jgi:hypothetical protein
LGGLVLSRFPWEANVEIPQFALWQAHSDFTAIMWVVVTFGLAWSLTRLATRALARGSSSRISWTLMISQAVLLIPVRDPSLVGPIAMLGFLGAVGLELSWRKRSAMRTFEGTMIRLLYWVAPAIVVGRCIVFYGFDALAFGCLVVALGSAIFFASRTAHESSQAVGENAGAIIAAIGMGIVGIEIKQMIWPDTPLHLLSALPLAAVLYGFSHMAQRGRRFLTSCAAAVSTLAAIGAVVVNGGILSGVSALIIGVGCVALGLLDDRRTVVYSGGVAALAGLVCTVETAIGLSSLMNWGSLTVIGVSSLLTAAFVERHRGQIVRWLERAQRLEAARRNLQVRSAAGAVAVGASGPSAGAASGSSEASARTPNWNRAGAA